MKKSILLTCLLLWSLGASSQTNDPQIDKAITEGYYSKAQELIHQKIATSTLSDLERKELSLQSTLLDRIKMDFSRDEATIRKQLKKYYPHLTDTQMETWEASNELEMRIIEGEKRYFRNAVWNLFRINKEAKAVKEKVDGKRKDELFSFVEGYLPTAVAQMKSGEAANPRKIAYTYTLTVKPDVVPPGEIIRAWLPYPRSDRQRLTDVELQNTSLPHYVIAPDTYPHKSIYMEQRAKAGEPTVFSFKVAYTAKDEWYDLLGASDLAYTTDSDSFQKYTAERSHHIQFTPAIRELSEEIIGKEQRPLQKAWLIYQWIGENIPWASALEYSTMPNIPLYCIENKSGDCGMKALLFITLCRYNGIPAKWQSGWFLYPDNINLHDWAEIYIEGTGWVPVDPDFNIQDIPDNKQASTFFFGGADAYRLIVNDDFGGDFFPAKIHHRSETVDFQRGEVEWQGGNLYFDKWKYKMEVSYD